MPRAHVVVLLAASSLLFDCKKKAPSFEDQIASGLTTEGITVPAASGATVPIPHAGLVVLLKHDTVGLDAADTFAVMPSPLIVFKYDPAHAATDGADAKFKKTTSDPTIVPLLNASYAAVERHPENKSAAMIAGAEPLPAQLVKEIRATLASNGITAHYRLVRTSDGKVAAEKLP